jgi:hypothetical protein
MSLALCSWWYKAVWIFLKLRVFFLPPSLDAPALRFGKSTALYASWLVTLIVVGEYATGKMTDSIWTMNNYGKTFETVEWSKFDQFEDEEEEEEEESEDDEDDDE